MRIQTRDGNARSARHSTISLSGGAELQRSTSEKIGKQQADTDYLGLFESIGNFAEWNVCCHERDREFSAGQTHCEIFHAAALGEKFGLPGKLKTHFVHPGLVNGPRYYRI